MPHTPHLQCSVLLGSQPFFFFLPFLPFFFFPMGFFCVCVVSGDTLSAAACRRAGLSAAPGAGASAASQLGAVRAAQGRWQRRGGAVGRAEPPSEAAPCWERAATAPRPPPAWGLRARGHPGLVGTEPFDPAGRVLQRGQRSAPGSVPAARPAGQLGVPGLAAGPGSCTAVGVPHGHRRLRPPQAGLGHFRGAPLSLSLFQKVTR